MTKKQAIKSYWPIIQGYSNAVESTVLTALRLGMPTGLAATAALAGLIRAFARIHWMKNEEIRDVIASAVNDNLVIMQRSPKKPRRKRQKK